MTEPAYLDPSRPVAERVQALLELMTEEQKLACFRGIPAGLTLADGFELPGVDNRFEEVLHGSGHHENATLFPQAIGLGSTWDTDLLERIGQTVATEMRERDPGVLAAFGPVADIRSNPLAGRYEEGFGEDPLHVGAMATAYATGLRGRHEHWVRVLPQMKHFLGYNHELHRHRTSASMSVRALQEYQAVPYRKPVEAGAVLGAMTAYNLVNGVPSIIAPIMEELREEWAPEGFMFLPDGWDAVNLHTTKGAPFDTWEVPEGRDVPYPAALAAELGRELDAEEVGVWASGLMLLAGQTNFADGSELPLGERAAEAVRQRLFGLTGADVDRVVRDWLTVMVRCGRLDGEACPYNRIEVRARPDDKDASRALALQAAREQLVLLRNDSLLPLEGTPKVAVLGPLSDVNLRDYYSPLVPDERRVTPLEAIRDRVGADNVLHHRGNDAVAWRAEAGYVSARADGPLRAGADRVGPGESFEVFDWGHDQFMFRNAGTGRFVSADILQPQDGPATFTNQAGVGGSASAPLLRADDDRMVDANAWFTFQNFHYRRVGERVSIFGLNHVEADICADDAFHVRVAEDGTLPLSRGDAALPLTETVVEDGCEQAAGLAAEADFAVVFVGNHPLINARECFDRPGLDLAEHQAELVRAVAAARPGRTVVVVVSSYPLAIGQIAADPNVAAILYTSHAGQAAGTALAEALFGDFSPAGRLTSTWLPDTSSLPKPGPVTEQFRVSEVDMLEYDVIAAGLTYRYSRAEPVFPFGHGLTYTTFEYGPLELPERAESRQPFTAAFELVNTGDRTSDEVVLLFARSRDSAYGDRVPIRQLAAFTRVKDVRPGERRRVEIAVDPEDLFVWDVVSGSRIVETGDYAFTVGDRGEERIVRIEGATIGELDLSEPQNIWEKATIARGVTYWEVSKRNTLARRGGYHSVAGRRPGDFVGFTKVNLAGARTVELRAATTAADWADLTDPVVEVRRGAADGPLLAEVTVPVTGGRQKFEPASAPLTGAGGTDDLYLVFRAGGIYLDTIRLGR